MTPAMGRSLACQIPLHDSGSGEHSGCHAQLTPFKTVVIMLEPSVPYVEIYCLPEGEPTRMI